MDKKLFYIEGKKRLTLLREQNFYICFDPIKLEYFHINVTGAYILYLVSKKCKLDTIFNIFIDEYKIEKNECREIVLSFLDNFPLKNIIYHNLIDNDIYLELPPFK